MRDDIFATLMRTDFYNSGTCNNRRAAAEQCIEMLICGGSNITDLLFLTL